MYAVRVVGIERKCEDLTIFIRNAEIAHQSDGGRFPKFRISLGADVLLRVAVGLHSPYCLLICPLREEKHLTYYYDGALRKRSSSAQIRLSHTGPASSTSDTEIFRGRDTRQMASYESPR